MYVVHVCVAHTCNSSNVMPLPLFSNNINAALDARVAAVWVWGADVEYGAVALLGSKSHPYHEQQQQENRTFN